jgi:EmrB/QacA subfamily drug resistance transporter
MLVLERRWIFFALASLSMLMFSIDWTIVAVAIRTIVDDFGTTLALTGWTITGFSLAQTSALPLVGKLGEQFGQLRVFVGCVVVFTIGSLLCGLAPTIYVLIACRILQAIGGAGFMPSAMAIIAQEFPRNRSRMIGLFSSILPLGGIIGPNLGGYIIQHYGWREVFLVNVPIGMVVIPLLTWQMRATGQHRAPARGDIRQLDVAGSLLFAGSIVLLLLALSVLGDDPSFVWQAPFWLLLVASAALLVLFVRQERRVAEPVIELGLVTRHPFLVVNLYNFIFGVCVFGCFTFIPYYASVQYGMGPFESGAVLTPRSIAMVAISFGTSLLLLRLGYRIPIVAGMVIMMVAMVAIGQGWEQLAVGALMIGPFGLLAACVALTGVAMGLLMPSSNNAALDLLPERTAVIAGLRGFFRQIGGVIGTAAIVVALSLSPDKAAGMRTIYTTLGLALIVTIPLAFLIPDAARERRQATLAKAAVAKAAVRDQTADGSRASAEEEPASVSGLPPSRGAI